jgi:hypothetical protein
MQTGKTVEEFLYDTFKKRGQDLGTAVSEKNKYKASHEAKCNKSFVDYRNSGTDFHVCNGFKNCRCCKTCITTPD